MKTDSAAHDIPQISESDVRQWVSEASFSRGWTYFHTGHIIDPGRQGHLLRGKCLGSSEPYYRVEVLLGPEGIASASCACPVGYSGRCKHAAALLLTWVHQPEAFRYIEELDAALQRRDKTQLITIIRRMLERDPDLEDLLELPVIGEGQPQPVDPDAIRRQAARAYDEFSYEDDSLTDLYKRLGMLIDLSDQYAGRGDCASALIIYRAVSQEIMGHYETIPDEEGDLATLVGRCVDGMGACLEGEPDPPAREAILHALFDIFRQDMVLGGYGLSDGVSDIILAHATAEEKQALARHVRAAAAGNHKSKNTFAQQGYEEFLLELEADTLDDDTFVRRCREAQHWQDLIERLLTLGRIEEAIADARNLQDYDLLLAADLFVAHGLAAEADQLMHERARRSDDPGIVTWLKARAETRGDLGEAFTLAEKLFWKWPSLDTYGELRDAARRAGEWDRLPRQIVSRLRSEQRRSLLVEILLAEGEIDDALKAYTELRAKPDMMWNAALAMQLADAAEATRPDAAIEIYIAEAERAIGARNRAAYQAASHYLSRAHSLLLQRGEPLRWQQLIRGIRTHYSRLSALQDELDKAGL
jgi:uncharacterized Zn finger protein